MLYVIPWGFKAAILDEENRGQLDKVAKATKGKQ